MKTILVINDDPDTIELVEFNLFGFKTVRYGEVVRQPVPEIVEIPIFSERKDIPYKFKLIGQVRARPTTPERNLGDAPVFDFKKQARVIGGKALLNLRESQEANIWLADVIVQSE